MPGLGRASEGREYRGCDSPPPAYVVVIGGEGGYGGGSENRSVMPFGNPIRIDGARPWQPNSGNLGRRWR